MQVEGQRGECLHSLPATGARVSNTYATYPFQGDNLSKERLIPRISLGGIPWGGKDNRKRMGMRRIRQTAG